MSKLYDRIEFGFEDKLWKNPNDIICTISKLHNRIYYRANFDKKGNLLSYSQSDGIKFWIDSITKNRVIVIERGSTKILAIYDENRNRIVFESNKK